MNPIPILIEMFSLILLASVFHELGHYIYFMFFKTWPVIKVEPIKLRVSMGSFEDYKDFTRLDHILLNIYGIVIGLLPFLFGFVIYRPFLPVFIGSILIYFMGCYHDFWRIYRNAKK